MIHGTKLMKCMKTQLELGWTKALSILSLDDWGVWKHITFNFEEEEIKPKEFTILSSGQVFLKTGVR